MRRLGPIGLAAALATIALPAAALSRPRRSASAVPMPPASAFRARVTNPWFPLKPGARWVYTGVKGGRASRDVVTVPGRTSTIAGIPSVEVADRLYIGGRVAERTTDFYSQDSRGNVWYVGEVTAELDRHGRVTSTEGSWRTGVDGAQAGVFMPARPKVGDSFRQEYLQGQAEDHFRVIGLLGGRAKTTLVTQEWTPLEPGVIDHKLYVRGIGTVWEQTEHGGNERNELVSFTGG